LSRTKKALYFTRKPLNNVPSTLILMRFLGYICKRSRKILNWCLCGRIGAENTVGLLIGAVMRYNAVPLAVKFDRGSEFNNSKLFELLEAKHVMPLPCPRRSPYYNGKYERMNRDLKSRLRAMRVRSFDKIFDAAEEAVDMVNSMPRRMFAGRNSNRLYNECEPFDEAQRVELGNRALIEIERLAACGIKRMDRLDIQRKAVEMALIDLGLLRIADKNERVSYCKPTFRDIVRILKLEPNSGRDNNKWSPEDGTLEEIKQQYSAKEVRDMFGFIPRTKPVSDKTDSQDVSPDGTTNNGGKFFRIYLPD
jgi:hypothetical protein